MNTHSINMQKQIHEQALQLVERARWHGVVLTIQTEPRQPLAMGNYSMVVDTRLTKEAHARSAA